MERNIFLYCFVLTLAIESQLSWAVPVATPTTTTTTTTLVPLPDIGEPLEPAPEAVTTTKKTTPKAVTTTKTTVPKAVTTVATTPKAVTTTKTTTPKAVTTVTTTPKAETTVTKVPKAVTTITTTPKAVTTTKTTTPKDVTTVPKAVTTVTATPKAVTTTITPKAVKTTPEAKTTTPKSVTTTPTANTTSGPWKRTVILLRKETAYLQEVFFRGGAFGGEKIPIRHRHIEVGLKKTPARDSWTEGDNYLDWHGPEQGQGEWKGKKAGGSPGQWTVNDPTLPYSFPLNSYGAHFWLLDVDMDCSRTTDGFFEFKGYLKGPNVEVWERDIPWSTDTSPCVTLSRKSDNHVGMCGRINVFHWNLNKCEIKDF